MSEPTEDSLVIVNRRPGRPRAKEQGIRLSTWIPLSEYDRVLQRVNQKDDTSLSRFLREAIRKELGR